MFMFIPRQRVKILIQKKKKKRKIFCIFEPKARVRNRINSAAANVHKHFGTRKNFLSLSVLGYLILETLVFLFMTFYDNP